MPPTKRTKDEETDEMTEKAQEESVDYNKFYSKFIQRALGTTGDKFDIIQDSIDNHGMGCQIENIRSITEYIDLLQKMLSLVQQIEEKDKKEKEND